MEISGKIPQTARNLQVNRWNWKYTKLSNLSSKRQTPHGFSKLWKLVLNIWIGIFKLG